MSRFSRVIVFIAIALFSATQVSAHGHLSTPISREYMHTYAEQDFPVSFPLGGDFVCKNMAPLQSSMRTILTAGQPTTVSWGLAAAHPGDCFAYISYDVNVTDTEKKWFKVAAFRDCNSATMNTIPQTFTLPDYLPSCEHCILRWEWYALHLQPVGSVEYYAQCADIKIIGKSNGVLPTPQVTIPGHIPMNADMYRDPYADNAYLGKLIGPPIATIGGAPYNCTATYDGSCTTAPPQRGECLVSVQRCVTASTYQACGIGRTQPEWYAPQQCQTGLVCVPAPGDRINCVRPEQVPPNYSVPSIPVTSAKATTGYASRPVTTSPAVPSTTAAAVRLTTAAGAAVPPRPATTAPATTAQAPVISIPSAPSPVVPQTPSTTSRTQGLSSTCSASSQGYMRCETSETYSICDVGKWTTAQRCQVGLTCSPAGNYIYCV